VQPTGRATRAQRSVLGPCLLGMLLALLSAPSANASAGVVGAYSWRPPVLFDPTSALPPFGLTISCRSESFCAVVDQSGNVATSADPAGGASTWRLTHIDSNTHSCGESTCSASLSGISCPSASLCVAVDTAGYVFWSTTPARDTGWQSARISGTTALLAVSCPSVSLCVSVDSAGAVATSSNPTGGPSAWHTATVDSGPCPSECTPYLHPPHALLSVSCPSVSLCVAGDSYGEVVTSTDPTGGRGAWNVAYVDRNFFIGMIAPGGQTSLTSVSCPSTSLCVASDERGGVVTSNDPAGGSSAWRLTVAAAPPSFGIDSLSCPSASRCIALNAGTSDAVLTDEPRSGTTWVPVVIKPGDEEPNARSLTSISCPSVLFCAVVDEAGQVIVGHAQLLSRAAIHGLLKTAIGRHGEPSLLALSSSGRFPQAFNAPSAGSVRIRWLLAPAPGTGSPSLIARGQDSVPAPGPVTIAIVLTKRAVALLRHLGRVRLTAEASFSPAIGRPLRATSTFVLRR
jgi:hypothetical protein